MILPHPSIPGNKCGSQKSTDTKACMHKHTHTHSALIRTPVLLVLQRVTGSVSKPHSSLQMALFRLHGNLTLLESTDALPAAPRRRRHSQQHSFFEPQTFFYKPSAFCFQSHLQPFDLCCSLFLFSNTLLFVYLT